MTGDRLLLGTPLARSLSFALAVLATLSMGCGCAMQGVPLVNITGGGEQWVWPYFLDGQPTVIAFWNTDEMQCLRDVPALTALDAREGSVQLVTVVTGRDRMEIDRWLRGRRIRYVVLLDLEERLADRLGVDSYPTFIAFDARGKEASRVTDIRLVHNWFDQPRWLERLGAIAPASGRVASEDESYRW